MQIPKGYEVVNKPKVPKGYEIVDTTIPTVGPIDPQQSINQATRKRKREQEKFGFEKAIQPFKEDTIASAEFLQPRDENVVSGAARTLLRGGGQALELGLDTLETGFNLASQGIAKLTGSDPEEVRETLDIAGLPLVGGAKSLNIRKVTGQKKLTATQKEMRQLQEQTPDFVPMSRADLDQDLKMQSFMEEARQGLHGQQARNMVEAFNETQDTALLDNLKTMQRQMTGRARETQEAGIPSQQVANSVFEAAKLQRAKIKDAYDNARQFDAKIDAQVLNDFAKVGKQSLIEDGFDLASMPTATKRLNELNNMTDAGKITQRSVKSIETWRKRVVNDIENNRVSNPAEAAALRKVKFEYDNLINNAIDEGLIRGNDEALDAWKSARDLRRDYGKRFEADNIVKRMVDLELNQDEAVNLLFGSSKMGFKTNSARAIQNIKKAVGSDSPAIDAMKEEALLRLMRSQAPDKPFSGAKFASALDNMLTNNQQVMSELFSGEELKQLKDFARLANRVTSKKRGAVNYSESAPFFARLAQGGVFNRFLGGVGEAVLGPFIQARREIKGAKEVVNMLNVHDQIKPLKTDRDIFKRSMYLTNQQRQNDEEENN